MHYQSITSRIDHSLVFIDTGADPHFPIMEKEELWNQGDIQLSGLPLSRCCTSLIIEHNEHLYCTGCGCDVLSHEPTDESINLITH